MKVYAFIFINWTYNYNFNIPFTYLQKKSGHPDTSVRRDLLVSNLTAHFVNWNYRKGVDWVPVLLSILSCDFRSLVSPSKTICLRAREGRLNRNRLKNTLLSYNGYIRSSNHPDIQSLNPERHCRLDIKRFDCIGG